LQAGFHFSNNSGFLMLYNAHPETSVSAPPSIKESARHVAHVTYKDGSRRSISVYQIPTSLVMEGRTKFEFEFARSRRVYELSESVRREVRSAYQVEITHTADAPTETIDAVLCDIIEYMEEKGSNTSKLTGSLSSPIKVVSKIVPNKEICNYGDVTIQTWGKQDYVGSCVIDINVDFFYDTCATLGTAQGYFNPWNACDYCYARSRFVNSPFKAVRRVDYKSLVEQIEAAKKERAEKSLPTRYLRFGKMSEPGSDLTRESFLTTLLASAETGVKPIIPTKFLCYSEDAAELLKRSGAAVLFSLGSDSLEQGALSWGCDNQFRLKQAQRYHQKGVNTILYQLIDATNLGNPLFKPTLDVSLALHKKEGVPIQFLPLRPLGRKQLERFFGRTYASMQGQTSLFDSPTASEFEAGLLSLVREPGNRYLVGTIAPELEQLLNQPGV